MKRKPKGEVPVYLTRINNPDLYVVDLNFIVQLTDAKWPRTFQVLIMSVIDVLCAIELLMAIAAVIMTSTTTSAENLGAAIIDIACMSQICSHVHISIVRRSEIASSLKSLFIVATVMQESCSFNARKKLRRWAIIIRGITVGTFLTIALCLLICLKLNRPYGQTTPVATWPAPGPDITSIVSILQIYATLSGSLIFCIASSVHFGSILYTATLFTGLSSCIRCLHLRPYSEEFRYLQFVKYVKCHQLLLRAVLDINRICRSLLFSRVNATFVVLVYTGMNIALGYVSVRVVWMTAFGFGTLFLLTVTGQYLLESAERVAQALYQSHWHKEGTEFRTILSIALQRTTEPLLLSTWLRRNCDFPYFIEFLKSWYSSVQMMYNTRISRSHKRQ